MRPVAEQSIVRAAVALSLDQESTTLPVISAGDYMGETLTTIDYDGSNFLTGVAAAYAPGIARFGLHCHSQRQRGISFRSGIPRCRSE